MSRTMFQSGEKDGQNQDSPGPQPSHSLTHSQVPGLLAGGTWTHPDLEEL